MLDIEYAGYDGGQATEYHQPYRKSEYKRTKMCSKEYLLK